MGSITVSAPLDSPLLAGSLIARPAGGWTWQSPDIIDSRGKDSQRTRKVRRARLVPGAIGDAGRHPAPARAENRRAAGRVSHRVCSAGSRGPVGRRDRVVPVDPGSDRAVAHVPRTGDAAGVVGACVGTRERQLGQIAAVLGAQWNDSSVPAALPPFVNHREENQRKQRRRQHSAHQRCRDPFHDVATQPPAGHNR